jgi:hypothetical protein
MYKSIMLSNREHTREVICSAMLKHGLEGSPDDFTLAQMLPDKGTSTATPQTTLGSIQRNSAMRKMNGSVYFPSSLLFNSDIS